METVDDRELNINTEAVDGSGRIRVVETIGALKVSTKGKVGLPIPEYTFDSSKPNEKAAGSLEKTREFHNHHFDSTIWNGFSLATR